jgi:thiamine-phosphate pyrophosphorylase
MKEEEALRRRWLLAQARLYVIVDLAYLPDCQAQAVAEAALLGGADILQLRAKGREARELFALAKELASLCRRHSALFIINDWVELALEARADGAHVGQEDLPLAEARRRLGPTLVLGQSTHSLDQAIRAEEEGADYIGLGPIFPTPTKPAVPPVGLDLVSAVAARVRIPQFCIGGISQKTLPRVLAAGGKRVAVVSAVCQSSDPAEECRGLKSMLAALELWA